MKDARHGKRQSGSGSASADAQGNASKPVSLAPLSFDEALDGLLAVKPEPKGEAKKRPVKKTAKK